MRSNLARAETIESYARRVAASQAELLGGIDPDDAGFEDDHVFDAADEWLVQNLISTLRHDPEVLKAQHDTALRLREDGRLGEAGDLQTELVDAFTDTYGPAVLQTLAVKADLAMTLCAQGESELRTAASLQSEVVEAYHERYGHKDAKTLDAMTDLAKIARHKGDLDGAWMLFRTVYMTRIAVLGLSSPATVAAERLVEDTERDLAKANPSYGKHRIESPLVPPWAIPGGCGGYTDLSDCDDC